LLILFCFDLLLLHPGFLFFVLCLVFFSAFVTHQVILSDVTVASSHENPMARASICGLGSRSGANHLLAFDFGKPRIDMGMVRLKVSCLVKGSACFVKLSFC